MKNKKLLVSSLATILMSLSVAAGATYALFTSESETNIAITSGKVDVFATITDLTLSSKVGANETTGRWANGGTATLENNRITLTNMTPGDKVSFNIVVTNNSNVIVQSRNLYTATGSLLEALTISGFGTAQNRGFSNWEVLEVGSPVVTYPIEITLPETVGNEYQDKSATIDFSVEAVQGNAEVANPYDYDSASHTYSINNETGMMMLGSITSNLTDFGGDNHWIIKITKDMDMSGYDWKGLTFGHLATIDGQGHTIKNLNCVMDEYGRSGFISYVRNTRVENLTLENVTSTGTQAGIVAGHALDGFANHTHFKNITIKGNNTVSYQASSYEYQEEWCGVGAVFGVGKKFTEDPITFADGSNTTISYNNMITRMDVGNEYAFKFVADEEVPVTNNGTVTTVNDWYIYTTQSGLFMTRTGNYAISNAEGLIAFREMLATTNINLAYKTFKLLNDIDMTGTPWVTINRVHGEIPGQNISGMVFDGDGHKISNMEITGSGMVDLWQHFGDTVVFKNLTMDYISAIEPVVYGGSQFKGVFVGDLYSDLVFDNVIVSNSRISGYWGLGAFVGRAGADGSNVNIYFNNCEVRKVTIDAVWNYYVAGFVGLVNNYDDGTDTITFTGTNLITNFAVNCAEGNDTGGAIHTDVSELENVIVQEYVKNFQ